MPKKSSGQILHFGAVTYRVKGTGNLFSTLRSLQNADNVILNQLVLRQITDRELTVLSNFNKQRAQLDVRTFVFDEVFELNKIIIWTRPTSTSYPM